MKNTILILLIIGFAFSCKAQKTQPEVNLLKDGEKLTIEINQKSLLSYQYATMYPPEDVDSSYQRSGFIHPLKTISGHVLTRVQPEDHYHHYSIWNPWTHVLFEGDTLDFWNLIKKEGTVRFGGFKSTSKYEGVAEYQVLHEHVALKKGAEKIA